MYHKMFYANLLSVTYCIYMSDSLFESNSKINNQMTICPILDMKRKKNQFSEILFLQIQGVYYIFNNLCET